MARPYRFENVSPGDYYHVTARGSGRRVLFDDDADRKAYLEALQSYLDEYQGTLVAWCLMDNHVHLLFHLEIHSLSALMHALNTKYAQYFNGRHGHVGPVFQGRFDSRPIETEEHFVLAIKYIHLNPKDMSDVDWRTYPWSSYRCYFDNSAELETSLALDLLDGLKGFQRFHEEATLVEEVRLDGYRRRLNDAEAVAILKNRLGAQFSDALAMLPKDERDRELKALYALGLSARQLERLTGIGRSTVNRAVAGDY